LRSPSQVNSSVSIARFRPGSRFANSPQNTPTADAPFSSSRFAAICGISPCANPTISKRPRQAIERSAASVSGPPTES
jgi:hypothetical protein